MSAGVPSMPIRSGRKVPRTAMMMAPLMTAAITTVALFGAFELSSGMMAASAHALHGRRARHHDGRPVHGAFAAGVPGWRRCRATGDSDARCPHPAGSRALQGADGAQE